MQIRRKTVKRLAILAAVLGVLGTAAELVVHNRHARRESWLTELHEKGLAAYRAGDYGVAADSLDQYITLHDADDDTILAFAISRTRASAGRSASLQSAQKRLETILAARPDDLATQHALLELCPASGDLVAAERISDDILAAHPDDAAALEARVSTRLRQARYEDALTAAQQRADARPGDLDARLAAVQLMTRQRKPPAAVMAYAAGFNNAANDPSNLLLRAIATDYAGQREAALTLLRQAAGCPIADVAVAGQIVNQFNAFKRADEGRAYLQAAVAGGGGADLQRALALRLWQERKFDQFTTCLPALNDNADATVLALSTAALFELNRPSARDSLETLRRRTDRIADAWCDAIDARYATGVDAATAARQLAKALSRDPDNGIIRQWLGDCYDALGETTLAIRYWTAAAKQMPDWAAPCLQTSIGLLKQGRPAAAAQAASSAYDRLPCTETAVDLARTRLAALDASPRDSADENDLLQFVSTLPDRPAAQTVLPIRIALLVRVGRREEAQAVADEFLKSAAAIDAEMAVDLEHVLEENDLAGSDRLFSLCAPSRCTPHLMLVRAAWLARDGKADQATAEFQTALNASLGRDAFAWRLAFCQFQDTLPAPRALSTWRDFANDFPLSPAAQAAVASAAATRDDFALRNAATQRLRYLTLDAGEQWRLQRASLLIDAMKGDGTQPISNGVEAVTLLSDVVRDAPAWIAPRLQLAEALCQTGNAVTAVDHLKTAVAIDPASVAAVIDLIALLREQSRIDELPRLLRAFTPPAAMDDTSRVSLAATFADAGQSRQAVALLTDARHALPPQGQLLLAEQYRQGGDAAQTSKLYSILLAAPAPSPAALASAAEFYATHAQGDLARQTIQRLSQSHAPAQDIAIATGRFEERFGSEAVAYDQFKIAADTQSEAGAVALIDFHLRHGRTIEAAAAARQAVSRLPGSRILMDRLVEAEAASARGQRVDLKPLIDALSHDSSRAAEVAALNALSDLNENRAPSAALAMKLRQIAADFPADLPLAQQTVSLCLRQRNADAAVLVAQQTMDALPNDPSAARLVVDALRAAGRWGEMRLAAEQWQSRSATPSIDAGAARAEAMLAGGDAAAAMAALKPFADAIAADPRNQAQAATVLARVLLASGRRDEGIALLAPLLRDAAGRRSGREIARVTPALTDAVACFEAIDTATPQDAWEEQNDLACLMAGIGRKFSDRAALTIAAQHYRKYLAACPSDGDATVAMAGIEQQFGDMAAAETHLRGLLATDPRQWAAKNDLACLLLAEQKKLDEAQRLARDAATAVPTSATYQDTLARVLAATGHPGDARLAFEAALRLDPALLPARVALVRLMRDQGDMTAARTELRRVDGTLKANPRAYEYVADELTTLRAELTQLDQ